MYQAKSYKKQKLFFCPPVLKFQKMSTVSICDEACPSKIAACNLVKWAQLQIFFEDSIQIVK